MRGLRKLHLAGQLHPPPNLGVGHSVADFDLGPPDPEAARVTLADIGGGPGVRLGKPSAQWPVAFQIEPRRPR